MRVIIINILIYLLTFYLFEFERAFAAKPEQIFFQLKLKNDNHLLPQKFYHNNTVHIKIKKEFFNENFFENLKSKLNSYLSYIEVTCISNPFSFYLKNKKSGRNGLSRIFEIKYANGISPAEAALFLSTLQEIEYACPVIKTDFHLIPNDSLWEFQDELRTVKADKAWEILRGDSNVVIGLIDAEYDWKHVDLAGNVFTNKGEVPDNKKDDDNNGFIDDVHGWDFLDSTNYIDFSQGKISEDNDTRMQDADTKFAHGTLTGSCASAVTNNNTGMASAAPGCRLLPVKITSDLGFSAREHTGALYAAAMGANVINCSWNYVGYSPADRDVIKEISDKGILITASVGNNSRNIDGEQYRYENFNEVLYAASSDGDSIADFSNYGVLTGVYAPGKQIDVCLPGNRYSVSSGTSLSAPIISGAAALVKSMHPDWHPRQIFHQLRSTADRVFFDNDNAAQSLALGRLNMQKGLEYNIRFDSGKTVPGIEVSNALISSKTGKLGSMKQEILKLKVKNRLAPAEDINIEITSADNKIEIHNSAMNIESLETHQEEDLDISLQVSDEAKWYDTEGKMIIKFTARDYINYQLLKIPLEIIPDSSRRVTQKFTGLRSNNNEIPWLIIKSISSAGINTCWGAGILPNEKPFFFVTASDRLINAGSLNFFNDYGSRLELKIIAVEDGKAFLLGTHRDLAKPGRLFKSVDFGKTWQEIELPSEIIAVSNFSLADESRLLLVSEGNGSPVIYKSGNAGESWKKCSALPLLENEEIQNNSIISHADTIFLGTSRGKIIYSNDFGINWQSQLIDTNFTISKIHHFSESGAFAFLASAGKNFFAFLKRGTWEIDTSYDVQKILSYPKLLHHTINPERFLVCGNKAALYDVSYEKWEPVFLDSTDEKQLLNAEWTAFSSGNITRVWAAADSIKYFDIVKQLDYKSNRIIQHFNIYPNPCSDYIDIQIFLEESSDIEISIYNAIGMKAGKNFNYTAEKGVYETFRIDTRSFSQGFYYLRADAGGENNYLPFLIVR